MYYNLSAAVTAQYEKPSEIEDEIEKVVQEIPSCDFCHYSDITKREEWCKEQFRHFAQLGAQLMMKEMLGKTFETGYVARNKDGALRYFEIEPRRNHRDDEWWDRDYRSLTLDQKKYPEFDNLKWEDEPVPAKLLIIKETLK